MRADRVAAPTSGNLDELFNAAGRGDLLAFAELYDRTVPFVHGALRRVLNDGAPAATEQVYLRLWQIASSYASGERGAPRSAYCAIVTAMSAEIGLSARPL